MTLSKQRIDEIEALSCGNAEQRHIAAKSIPDLIAEREELIADSDRWFKAHGDATTQALENGQALSDAQAELKKERENGFALAAWQCIYVDGKTGLTSNDYGHQYCAKDVEIIALERERDDARQNCIDIATVKDAEIERLRAALAVGCTSMEFAFQTLNELNTSNYSHDDVCKINAEVCEVFPILSDAMDVTIEALGGNHE
jgi:hypothetical protein